MAAIDHDREDQVGMKLYSSFLIRCWVTRDSSPAEKVVFDIEHIQKGERLRVADLHDALEWIRTVCHHDAPGAEAPEAGTPELEP